MTAAVKKNDPWTTETEIRHLNGMEKRLGAGFDRGMLGYIKGCQERLEWGILDKEKIMARAVELLEEFRGRRKSVAW